MEEVIIVNDRDEQLGTMEKMEAHSKAILHRAFSVFIFNEKGEMLLQQRALSKYHSGGLWTNACCSHPRPGEDTQAAAERRLKEEMGIVTYLSKIFDFRYKTLFDNGLAENEFDHVYVGHFDGKIDPNYAEVRDYCYKNIEDISASLTSHPHKYTSWFHIAFPRIMEWSRNKHSTLAGTV